jgi:hypothetical protein
LGGYPSSSTSGGQEQAINNEEGAADRGEYRQAAGAILFQIFELFSRDTLGE